MPISNTRNKLATLQPWPPPPLPPPLKKLSRWRLKLSLRLVSSEVTNKGWYVINIYSVRYVYYGYLLSR